MMSSCGLWWPCRTTPTTVQQHQQHGEHGQEGRVGDLGGQLAGLVVGVLAHHGARDGGDRSALLHRSTPSTVEVMPPVRPDHRRPTGAAIRPLQGSPTDKVLPAVPRELGPQPARSASSMGTVVERGPPAPEDGVVAPPPPVGPQRVLGDLAAGRQGQGPGDPDEGRGPLGPEVGLGGQEGREAPRGRSPGPGAARRRPCTWSPDRGSGTE